MWPLASVLVWLDIIDAKQEEENIYSNIIQI
jgi:hypothetical protein